MISFKVKNAVSLFFFKLSSKIRTHKSIVLVTAASLVFVMAGVFIYFVAIRPENSYLGTRLRISLAERRFNNMSNIDYLYDFEYLMRVLEENWPFFDLSVSANGVDVRELADDMRGLLAGEGIGDAHDFLDLLHGHFLEPIGQLGHLAAWRRHEVFSDNVNSVRNRINWHRRFGWPVPAESLLMYEIMTRWESVFFYNSLKDAERCAPQREDAFTSIYESEIIEVGNIAYLRVNRMLPYWLDPWAPMGNYETYLYDFHQSIQGHNHLIIDLRGNRGGNHVHFDHFVIRPIIRGRPATARFPFLVFYMGGEYSVAYREAFHLDARAGISPELLPLAGWDDLPYLDAGIDFHAGLRSAYASSFLRPIWPEWQTPWRRVSFGGKVWLLIDGYTASAAEAVTATLKYSNLATVVGEPTWGVIGTVFDPVSAFISLPNTGIILRVDIAYYTDRQGRPLQGYGIQPHYPNSPGTDALETVLTMIQEREGGI